VIENTVLENKEISMESPDYVRTSLAAGITLGLKEGIFYRNVVLRGLNLLVTYDKKCSANCSYCGLSAKREVSRNKETFIRVDWPVYPLDLIIEKVNTKKHKMQRVCVGMITRREALEDSVYIIKRLKKETDLLISALVTPTVLKSGELARLKEAGADMCGIAIDCATPELFEKHRGKPVSGPHSWSKYWETVKEAIEVFGKYKVGIHLVVGLGETEEEMIKTIQQAHDLGAHTHLFSFFPEAGSYLEDNPQPSYGQYRRVQLARYLINHDIARVDQMVFNQKGQITDFGCDIEPFLADGEAFMTSGCPGHDGKVACNRPFGNERPSKPFRNFPFLPEAEDLALIRSQIWQDLSQE
jgi:biotin synthase-related radical SAM superfamily protein